MKTRYLILFYILTFPLITMLKWLGIPDWNILGRIITLAILMLNAAAIFTVLIRIGRKIIRYFTCYHIEYKYPKNWQKPRNKK